MVTTEDYKFFDFLAPYVWPTYTKKEIADFYGVTSSHICKINKGMKEPNHSHSRWSDIN